MSNETPAQQFRKLATKAQSLNRQRNDLEKRSNRLLKEIEDLEEKAYEIVVNEIEFKAEDLVIDEMGVVYRVDSVNSRGLHWRYQTRNSLSTLTQATESLHIRGVALTKAGLPRWKDARSIRGKIKRYKP